MMKMIQVVMRLCVLRATRARNSSTLLTKLQIKGKLKSVKMKRKERVEGR